MIRKALFSILLTFGTLAMLAGGASESQAACTADLKCSNGYDLHCNGSSFCQSGSAWVECDGVRTGCPCYVERNCPLGGGPVSCYGWSSCSQGFARVSCDGETFWCPLVEGT